MDTTMDRTVLESKHLPELQQIAQSLGLAGVQKLRKAGLIQAIVDAGNGDGSGDGNGSGAATTVEDAPEPETQAGDGGDRDGGDRPRDRDRGRGDRGGQGGRGERNQGGGNQGNQSATRATATRATRAATETRATERPSRRPEPGQPSRATRARATRARAATPTTAIVGAGPVARIAAASARSVGCARRPIASRSSRPPRARPGSSTSSPTATGSCGPLATCRRPGDLYVSLSLVRKYSLRKGDTITGKVRQARNTEKYPALLSVESVNGMDPEVAATRPVFDKLTPLFPDERFRLESGPLAITERIVDMISPIGKGQRGMVVAPPKAGKTTILKQIANGIINSSPDTHVIVLLVDERPEEVTDWQRTVTAAEVVYSTFDKPTDQHIQITELVLERAKRLAEMGQDVAIMLDNLTRLTRAYNLAMPASGKILTGGIDASALYPPRRFFGAARNIEEGGSITIIASALVETGSRMDDGIFEEFKGTGNMELRLDRQLAEKRLFPAINVDASSTRKEELLLPPEELALVIRLRRVLHALDSGAALELLIDKLRSTKSNELFLKDIAKAPAGG